MFSIENTKWDTIERNMFYILPQTNHNISISEESTRPTCNSSISLRPHKNLPVWILNHRRVLRRLRHLRYHSRATIASKSRILEHDKIVIIASNWYSCISLYARSIISILYLYPPDSFLDVLAKFYKVWLPPILIDCFIYKKIRFEVTSSLRDLF